MVEIHDPLMVVDALAVFDDLIPYIERIEHKADGMDVERLRALVKAGSVTLHPLSEEGFCIASWGKAEMNVLSAGMFSLRCSDVAGYISATVSYAKKHNCSRIRFKSGRPAWRKIAPKYGFTHEGDNLYVREI